MRKITFANDEYYHIYNRGVEKRTVFLGHRDYRRMIHYLYILNDLIPVDNICRLIEDEIEQGLALLREKRPSRELLVDLCSFCLMPNHFHLLLRQRAEDGISTFMQRLGTAYTMFFNRKYNRSGALFQGTFKAKHVTNDSYLTHLSRYIHLNPLDLSKRDWRHRGLDGREKTRKVLWDYPWSSYRDYLGQNEYASIINSQSILGDFRSPAEYERFVLSWRAPELERVQEFIFEE